ncbi:MAG: SsrA-binding protein SmpB [Acidimicrobiia bacterium]
MPAKSTKKSGLPAGATVVASNRRARHDFAILDTYEAGLVLKGSEVKSLREGKVQLVDAYARPDKGELWLHGVHIAPWAFAHGFGAVDPDRSRKLLLHRHEIDEISARMGQERLTLVPLTIFFLDGVAKVELGLAKGRKTEDRRQVIAERDVARETARYLGRSRKGMID